MELRERFAFAEAEIPAALKSLRAAGVAGRGGDSLDLQPRGDLRRHGAWNRRRAFAELKEFLAAPSRLRRCALGDEIYTFAEPQSLHHLFKVACGLDSMVLGRDGNSRPAQGRLRPRAQAQHTGARLNKAFQRAFNVAKHIRTETNIQRGSVSVASVAVELAEKIFSSLGRTRSAGHRRGRHQRKDRARPAFARRKTASSWPTARFDRAQALAGELGGRAVPFDDWAGEFEKIDIAISSTAAPHHILDRAKLEPLMKRAQESAAAAD